MPRKPFIPRNHIPDEQYGHGIFDVISKVASKVGPQILEKGAAKAVEQIGDKTGKLIGEKIYNKFSDNHERGGKQIIKELRKVNGTEPVSSSNISKEFNKLLHM